MHGYGKGDQHIRVRVVTPTKLTERQKQLLREFEQLSQGNGQEDSFLRK